MTDDTDSDWDSSMLDFSVTPRGPRVIGFNQQPPKEMDAIEEASEHSREDQHRPKKGTKPLARSKSREFTANSRRGDNSRSDENLLTTSPTNQLIDKNLLQTGTPSSDKLNPPYNFRGVCSTDGEGPDKTPKAPGRSRKGKMYDPKPAVESEEINLWGNSDEEERVLQQVRKNFTQSKPDMPIHHSSAQPPPVKQSSTQAAGTTHIDLNRSPGTISREKQKLTSNRNSNHSLGISGQKGKEKSRCDQDYMTDVGQGVQTFLALGDTVNGEHSPSSGKFIRQALVEDGPHGKRYLYQFDQRTMRYYEVEDVSSSSVMPRLAEKVEKVAGRGFQELFGCLKIVFICVVLFTVELMKFLFGTILGPILSGFIITVGDYLLKPLFAGLFNSLLHPFFALLWNILASLHNALGPLLQITREMISQLALLLGAFRLVQITTVSDKRAQHSQTIQDV